MIWGLPCSFAADTSYPYSGSLHMGSCLHNPQSNKWRRKNESFRTEENDRLGRRTSRSSCSHRKSHFSTADFRIYVPDPGRRFCGSSSRSHPEELLKLTGKTHSLRNREEETVFLPAYDKIRYLIRRYRYAVQKSYRRRDAQTVGLC